MNTTLILVIAILFAVPTDLDFLIYAVKSVPKRSMLSKWFWILGFIGNGIILYWYLNGMKF